MIKSLKKIQMENRRIILCSKNNTTKYSDVKNKEEPILLSDILQSLDMIKYYKTYLVMCEGIHLVGFDEKNNEVIDLSCEKQTLEEQSEETQRQINELLTGDKYD